MASGARAGAISPELLARLEATPSDAQIEVIVELRDRLALPAHGRAARQVRRAAAVQALRAHAATTQAPLRAVLAARGARRVASLWVVNALAVTATPGVLLELAARSEVRAIRPDLAFHFVAEPAAAAAATAAPWNLEAIGVAGPWSAGYTGQGVVVASLDTGVDPAHPDLGSRWRGPVGGWLDPHGEHPSPFDADGHGTRALGLLVGGDESGVPIGVAPGARWIAAKVFDDSGDTTTSRIHETLQWLLDPDGDPTTDDAPDVALGSWYDAQSVGACDTEFEPDLAALRALEVATVWAAGNAGPAAATSVSPANLPSAFAAGAVDATLAVASFGSRGPSACDGGVFPDVVAPGVELRTADLTFGGVFPDSYVTVTGTSFSAPHVAGAMALLLNAFPGTRVSQLELALERSAFDLAAPGVDPDAGHGLVRPGLALLFLATSPLCSNGLDDDGDGLTDAPDDPGCENALSLLENPACDDGADNDDDGLVDFGADPECTSAWRGSETSDTGECRFGPAPALALATLGWCRRRASCAC